MKSSSIYFKRKPLLLKIYRGETSDQLEMSIRTLLYFMQGIEDEKKIKQFPTFVPKVLPGLFSAFTNDQVDAHGRE